MGVPEQVEGPSGHLAAGMNTSKNDGEGTKHMVDRTVEITPAVGHHLPRRPTFREQFGRLLWGSPPVDAEGYGSTGFSEWTGPYTTE